MRNSENKFRRNRKHVFLWIYPLLFCLYLSNQISLRGLFVFKMNGRVSTITSCKYCFCSFFTGQIIKQQKCHILTILKNLPTLGLKYAYFLTTYKLFCMIFQGYYKDILHISTDQGIFCTFFMLISCLKCRTFLHLFVKAHGHVK